MNERLKLLRKKLNMSQRDFSKRINVGASTLAMFETGQRELKSIHISAICREFNVNEHWLRTGEGTMFNETPPDDELSRYLGQLLKPDHKNAFIKKIILTYMRLDDDGKKIIRDFAESLGSKNH